MSNLHYDHLLEHATISTKQWGFLPGRSTTNSVLPATLAFVCKNATIAISLAVLFGLGWGFGLAASGTPSKDATFALQLLFTIFVGCQGIMIFVLHGIRKVEAQNEWKRWFSTLTSWFSCGRFSGNKMLDSTVSTFKSHATFSSRIKVHIKNRDTTN